MSEANDRRWARSLAGLDANLLVALDALLTESNVTRAARRVGVTQSAMSQTLARLRRQFDDAILVRVGRNMEPTPFALRIRDRLRRGLAELEAVVQDRPAFDSSEASRRFVLAAVDYLGLVVVPPLQREIADAPGLRLGLHTLDEAPITSRLGEGVVDLYVGVAGATERALRTERLFDESLCVLLDAEHPQAAGELSLEVYGTLPHVHVSPRREAGSIVTRALTAAGLSRDVAIEIPYFGLVPSLLVGQPHVATVPQSLAAILAERHGLVTRAPPVALPTFEVCMAWHPAFEEDPALRWLRETMRRLFFRRPSNHS